MKRKTKAAKKWGRCCCDWKLIGKIKTNKNFYNWSCPIITSPINVIKRRIPSDHPRKTFLLISSSAECICTSIAHSFLTLDWPAKLAHSWLQYIPTDLHFYPRFFFVFVRCYGRINWIPFWLLDAGANQNADTNASVPPKFIFVNSMTISKRKVPLIQLFIHTFFRWFIHS